MSEHPTACRSYHMCVGADPKHARLLYSSKHRYGKEVPNPKASKPSTPNSFNPENPHPTPCTNHRQCFGSPELQNPTHVKLEPSIPNPNLGFKKLTMKPQHPKQLNAATPLRWPQATNTTSSKPYVKHPFGKNIPNSAVHRVRLPGLSSGRRNLGLTTSQP